MNDIGGVVGSKTLLEFGGSLALMKKALDFEVEEAGETRKVCRVPEPKAHPKGINLRDSFLSARARSLVRL